MKKQLVGFSFGLVLASLPAFKAYEYQVRMSTAEVEKVDGLYIFTDCKPVLPYDSIGAVDAGFVTGTQYETIRDNIVKRVNKLYKDADGIVINYNKKGIDIGTVVKFRER